MGKYGDTAVQAAKLLRSGHRSGEDAWRQVAEAVFAGAPPAMKKTCPREAFLGLCQEGMLAGVPASCCRPVDRGLNRSYAVAAAQLLVAEPDLAHGNKAALWRCVMSKCCADPNKRHNSQLDVVLALWAEGWIDASAATQTASLA
ncbi:MAG TPA: hypothetical protein VF584_15960 [Longimicrobium sp.]|jgi:hypothetical protein